MPNPEGSTRKRLIKIRDGSFTHTDDRISKCAEIITEILTDNRETINLIFKDIKEKLKEDEDNGVEFVDMTKTLL